MSNWMRVLGGSLVVVASMAVGACASPVETGAPDEALAVAEQPIVDDGADGDLACTGDEKPFPGCTTPIKATDKACKELGTDNDPDFDNSKPTCLGTKESIDAHLAANPGACNRLKLPETGAKKWTECKNLLLMDCLKLKLLGNGKIVTTGPWPPPCNRKVTYSEYLYCKANDLVTTAATSTPSTSKVTSSIQSPQ